MIFLPIIKKNIYNIPIHSAFFICLLMRELLNFLKPVKYGISGINSIIVSLNLKFMNAL